MIRVVLSILTIMTIGCLDSVLLTGAAARDADLLYRSKCASCHRVYPPADHTYQKFVEYVDRYGKALNDDERHTILEYLKTNSRKE